MARPQVADRGTVCNMEGSCEYIEIAVAGSRQGVVFQLGILGEVLTTPHGKHLSRYEPFTKARNPEWSFVLLDRGILRDLVNTVMNFRVS